MKADPTGDGRTADLIPRRERDLVATGQVAQQGDAVVPGQPHEVRTGHGHPRTPRRAGRVAVEVRQALLEVQRRGHRAGAHAELHHGEGDVGLDADDDRLGAPQPGHLGDAAQRLEPERVEHVQRGDVDDDAAATGTGRSARRGRAGTAASRSRPGQCGPTRPGTSPVAGSRRAPVLSSQRAGTVLSGDRVAEQALGLLEAALQVTDGVDLAEVHPDGHQRLGDRRGQSGDDDARAHQT